jgi:hypothetical protein
MDRRYEAKRSFQQRTSIIKHDDMHVSKMTKDLGVNLFSSLIVLSGMTRTAFSSFPTMVSPPQKRPRCPDVDENGKGDPIMVAPIMTKAAS